MHMMYIHTHTHTHTQTYVQYMYLEQQAILVGRELRDADHSSSQKDATLFPSSWLGFVTGRTPHGAFQLRLGYSAVCFSSR